MFGKCQMTAFCYRLTRYSYLVSQYKRLHSSSCHTLTRLTGSIYNSNCRASVTKSLPLMQTANYSHICKRNAKSLTLCGRLIHGRSLDEDRAESVPFQLIRTTATSTRQLKDNIILMGSPGSGKTTLGQLLAAELERPILDIDNDFLEKKWNMSVHEKLAKLGSEEFLRAEAATTRELRDIHGSVICLTGSNPMDAAAMEHIKSLGKVIYLDVQPKDILHRLALMKVNRIVGQDDGLSMADILEYRKQFYEGNYDLRIICESNESVDSILNKVIQAVNEDERKTGYVSTRDDQRESCDRSFNDVVLEGLAWDGGLYVPDRYCPRFSQKQWSRLIPLTYQQRALRILEKWIHPSDIHPSDLVQMLSKAYSSDNFQDPAIVSVHRLYSRSSPEEQFIAELFHGPTASFKDAALQLMPMFFEHALQRNLKAAGDERYLILVATSGDTGGAVLSGFGKHAASATKVIVLYPENRISPIQKAQMTNVPGHNVHVVGVESDFDFCQNTIKSIFSDTHFTKSLQQNFGYKLSAANSLNWGRLLPQIVYHASVYLDLVHHGHIPMGNPVDLCIPTGNFGNILAAYYAKMMGIPYRRLICASNSNNILAEFVNTGHYNLRGRSLKVTSSPAIDILISSNLERFIFEVTYGNASKVQSYYKQLEEQGHFSLAKADFHHVKTTMLADWVTEGSVHRTIKKTFEDTGYLLDPHTAVGKAVANKFSSDAPMVIASTAHYGKFAPDVLQALGQPVPTGPEAQFNALEMLNPQPKMHAGLREGVLQDAKHHRVITASVDKVKQEITNYLKRFSNA